MRTVVVKEAGVPDILRRKDVEGDHSSVRKSGGLALEMDSRWCSPRGLQ